MNMLEVDSINHFNQSHKVIVLIVNARNLIILKLVHDKSFIKVIYRKTHLQTYPKYQDS